MLNNVRLLFDLKFKVKIRIRAINHSEEYINTKYLKQEKDIS